jgi:hypothetical protein
MMATLYRYRPRLVAGLAAFGLLFAAGQALAQGDVQVLPPGAGKATVEADSTRPRLAIKEITVSGERVDLREILRKAVEGEKKKHAGLTTFSYTRRIRSVMRFEGKKARTRIDDIVQRVYYRAPDQWVEVTAFDSTFTLNTDGSRREDDDEHGDEDDDEGGLDVSMESRSIEENPFYLERLDRFRFYQGPIHRTDSTAVFEIEFEPVSDFSDDTPGGTLWLLAPGYQIVREEFRFEKGLPAGWILKGLDLLTREWQQVEDRWLERRLTGRVTLAQGLGLKQMGVPKTIEFVVEYDDYRLNPDLPAAIFGETEE